MKKSFIVLFLFILITHLSVYSQQIDKELFKEYKTRSIGPAGMSGRVTAIAMVDSSPNIIYAGTASGGLWKSESGGTAWEPIFDDQLAASVGAVAIDQNNPDVIWVGTGEGNPRNSVSSGYGVYKSIDGGKSWKLMGLEKTRNIHRLIIDKNNPEIVYVGAIGSPWGDHPERGVFKTKDGGKSWVKILFVNERTGVSDMVVDPVNPNKIIVGMWEHRRWPWYFKSGGSGSGIYLTYDGGENWEHIDSEVGLPEGELGRIGLAIATSEPDRVYAYVESKSNAIFRSDDGGHTWNKASKDGDGSIGNRPFYYAEIYVDPSNENRLYSLFTYVNVSEDGGKSFSRFVNPSFIHVDNHAYYIHPEDPDFIILGNDGGLAITRDRGKTWNYSENLPIGQFYHVSIDNGLPYRVYGGMQDNGSWSGPSQVWRQGGIRNMFWQRIGYGDGFDVVPDPKDNTQGFSLSQGGNLLKYNRETGVLTGIKPFHPQGTLLRFNWNAGIAIDPFDSKTIYVGSQYLLKSHDEGNSWQVISPDLTTNDPDKQKQIDTGGLNIDNSGAENFTTIVSIAPSPVKQGVIWVGTDDGNVQITQDGGQTWNNVVDRIKEVPKGTWVTQIRASTYNEGEAFVVFEDHRRDNWEPYIFRTKDFGRSWQRLVDSQKVWGYALSFAQDPIEPKLMFCGTEFGLYVSLDEGENWTKWTQGYPTVSTMDMQIHPMEHDLVLGTFGRAIYILDDIRPLRTMAKEGMFKVLNQPLYVFDVPDSRLLRIGQNIGYRSTGHAFYTAENKPWGAMISYYINELSEKEEEKVIVEIFDQNNELVRKISRDAEKGFNRFNWNLRRDGVRNPGSPKPKKGADARSGAEILPGSYNLKISYSESTVEKPLIVQPDPRIEITMEQMREKNELIGQYNSVLLSVTEVVDRIDEATSSVDNISKLIKDSEGDDFDSLRKHGIEIKKELKILRERVLPKEMQGFSTDPELLNSKVRIASSAASSVLIPATETDKIKLDFAESAVQTYLQDFNDFFANEWKAYTEQVKSLEISLVKTY
jgi:photosystem II stability/assembly factor-like uncharacterized protein